MKRTLATLHLLLISPAVLFLLAVMVQRFPPLQQQPALTAQHIVTWYANRMWTLWILLLALPLSVLISGCISLLRDSGGRTDVARLPKKVLGALYPASARTSVAVTTVTAAVIVGIVILHMAAN
jgi:hypothetical protein